MKNKQRFIKEPKGSFFLFGPRGTGKSTWLRERLADALWFDLLDPQLHRQLVAHPERLRERLDADGVAKTVVIDGGALEGLVCQHLKAWVDYSATGNQLYFWRTQAGTEVDFVVYGETEFCAIEVKNSAKVNRKELSGLKTFLADYPGSRAALLYRGTERWMIDGISCLPCEAFLRNLEPNNEILPDRGT